MCTYVYCIRVILDDIQVCVRNVNVNLNPETQMSPISLWYMSMHAAIISFRFTYLPINTSHLSVRYRLLQITIASNSC